ncbi:MAG: serine/threonine protein kinase [Myxococcaceae bacterium]
MSLQPGTPIGKYVVSRKLAEGGMAEIYLATSLGPEGFEKEVVIKRVRSFLATDPGFVQMFIAEARVASRLNHANLVQIFDFDKHEDTFYLAMEYVRGHSLFDIRKRAKEQLCGMPPTLSAHVVTEVARGLAYAHRLTDKGKPLKLVHRDVTPHNVLVSFDGAVKLTDFGIAKAAGQRMTSPGMLKGKFAYMSPEQSRGDEVDSRSDVFSLGVVLWELLTGGRLFEGDSDVAVLRAVQQSAIPPPARLNPEVSKELDAIVMKALARDLDQRYQTAQELERALAQHVISVSTSVDDTDLPAYLASLFPEDATGSLTLPSEGGTGAGPPAGPPAFEPTDISANPPAPPGPLSPDEDPDGDTSVTGRGARAEEGRVLATPAGQTAVSRRLPRSTPAPLEGERAGGGTSGTAAFAPFKQTVPLRPVTLGGVATARPEPGPPADDGQRATSPGQPAPRRSGTLPLDPVRDFDLAVARHAGTLPLDPVRDADLLKVGEASPAGRVPHVAQEARAATPSPGPSLLRRLFLVVLGALALFGGAAAVLHFAQSEAGPPPVPTAPLPTAPDPLPEPPALPVAAPADPEPSDPALPGGGLDPDAGGELGAQAPSGDQGVLVVKATPWATLFIDGKYRGEIDGTRRRIPLPPGNHTVRFQHPSRTRSYPVTIEPQRETLREFNATH